MNPEQMPDLFEAAARATINARCAPSYLHDVRGSMQALYSAMELLGRSARAGAGENMSKVERACDLAKRAIGFHEKSTMGVLELLTAASSIPLAFDLEQLAADAAHFLRNDSATRSVNLTMVPGDHPFIKSERSKFQVLLVGLFTAAIDSAAPGSELLVEVIRRDEFAVLSLGSTAGYDESSMPVNMFVQQVSPHELTFAFARNFLKTNGGRLEIGTSRSGTTVLQVVYPSAVAET